MRYGKISEAMWTDKTFRRLSGCAKLLYIYLLSCSKCTAIGLFQLGLGAMEDEFGESRDEISGALSELSEKGLCTYEDGWISFHKYVKWNAPTSPNHARQIAFMVNEAVMKDAPLSAVANILHQCKTVLGGMRTAKGTYFDDFRKALDIPLLTQFTGGESKLRNCFDNGTAESPGKALPKGSKRAFKNEGLKEGSLRASEGLPSETETETEAEQKQSRDKSSAQCLIVEKPDGGRISISASVVNAVIRQTGFSFDALEKIVWGFGQENPGDLPAEEDADMWFLNLVSSFNATRGS